MAPRKLGILLAIAVGVVALALATRPWSVLGGADGDAPATAGAPGARDGATGARPQDVLAGARASRPEADGPLPPPVALDAVDRERDLHGVVVDADGRTVAGATLTAVWYVGAGVDLAGLDRDDPGRPGPSTRSASDGTFALRLRPGVEVGLRVTAAGFAPVEVSNCLAGGRVRVTLRAGVALRVTVKDPEGRSIEGVEIRVFERHPSPIRVDAHATTNDEGVARIGDLPPSTTVWADPSHPTRDCGLWTAVLLPASGEVARELVSRPGRTLRGRVVDAGTGAGIGGARVGETEWMRRSVTTDADGAFVFAGWAETEWNDGSVCVEAGGYAREVRGLFGFDDVTVLLTRGGAIVGRVTDGERRPVRGAEVFAIASDQARGGIRTRTGGDGRFVLETLPHDRPHVLVVMAPGFGRTLLDVPPRADGPGRIDVGDVVVPAARRIAGRVRTADGLPIPGATVTLVGCNPDRARLRDGASSSADAEVDDVGASAEAHTDDLGRFEFADLAPGRYAARVELPGMLPVVRELTVPPTRDVLDAELVVESGRPFRVTVEDDAGVPVPWAWVHVLNPDGQGRGVRLDDRGAAALTLPKRAVRLVVSTYGAIQGDDRRFTEERIERAIGPGSRSSRFVLVRAKPISGRVVGPDGGPLRDVEVEARVIGFTGAAPKTTTDPQGAFELWVPATTPATLHLPRFGLPWLEDAPPTYVGRLQGVAPGSRGVVLRAESLAFTAEQEVWVVDAAGQPLRGAVVASSFFGPGAPPRAETNVAGRATFTALPTVALAWSVHPPFDRPELLPADAQGVFPGDAPLVVRLGRGRRVAGRVAIPTGADLERLRVRFTADPDDDDPPAGSPDWIDVDPETGAFAKTLDPAEWEPGPTYAVAGGGPAKGPATHRSPHVEVGPESTEVVLVLEPLPSAGR